VRSFEIAIVCLLAGCGGPPRAALPTLAGWTTLESGTTESLRGLSVVDENVIWASGAHGIVLRSIDGGASWGLATVPMAEALDFRSLHAFDAGRAVVLSAGSPAFAYVTADGGATWQQTFSREGDGVFYDSLAFHGEEGIAIGDPLPSDDGPRFAVLVTHDGGTSWQDGDGPRAEEGEAAFAASNGCIALLPEPVLATSAARLLHLDGRSAPIPALTSASAGVFAIAFRDAQVGYAVGGDYAAPTAPGSFARTSDGGARWNAGTSPRGYRSSIAIGGSALIVVGTSGSDVSYDEGESWSAIDDVPLNAVRVLGRIAFAVGPEGRVVRMAL
jgi:photosystem II stability/assembly factor-like uncharacterized protein